MVRSFRNPLAAALAAGLMACHGGTPGDPSPAPPSPPPNGSSSAPANPLPEHVDGIAVQPLTEGDPVPLPPNLAVYYITAGYGKDAVLPDLRRVSRTPNGPLIDERLFTGNLENAYTMALNLDDGLIGVGVCEGMGRGVNCGTPSYPPMGDARPIAYISRDAGTSFTRLGDLPRGAWVHAVVDDQLLIGIWNQAGVGTARFEYFPSGAPVDPPVPNAIPLRVEAGLAWMTDDGSLYRDDGALLRQPQTFGHRAAAPQSLTRPLSLQSWFTLVPGGPGNDTSTFYLGRFDASGQLQAAFSWPAHIEPVVEFSDGLLIGNYALLNGPGLDFPAMLLDLNTGTIHPIHELTDALRAQENLLSPFLVAAQHLPNP